MIVTELHKGQGLGNQLWCYCVCRSIADELDVPYKILGSGNFKAKDFLDIDFGDASSIDEKYTIFHEQRFYDKQLDYVASSFDDRVLSLDQGTQIEGLFQSEKYFFDNIDRLKEYIKIQEEYKNLITIPNDVCILNIRGGEYKRYKRFNLPKSYWVNAMNSMKHKYGIKKFMVVTDDHDYAKALFPDIKIVKSGISESYIALHNTSFLIVSNSTFSYFPIKTKGEKPVVIAPKYFARFNDKLDKWASPANIYKDWLWLDRDGKLYTYDVCIEEVEELDFMYKNEYYILTNQEAINKKNLIYYIPTSVKKKLKLILSKVFPRNFG